VTPRVGPEGARGSADPDPRPACWLGSTYRLQLRPPDLEGARALLPSLARLGITTLYLSPIARALPGSRHGYDVADPTSVDPALGGFAAWERLAETAWSLGLGLLVDSVPNHQAAHEENPWWADVLRHGRRSPHARVFDVDWRAHEGRLLLPILDRPLADALETRILRVAVARERGEPRGIHPREPVLAVHDRRLPIGPGTWEDLAPTPAALARRCGGSRRGTGVVQELLSRQAWRLAWWRTAPADQNYRRFFDVTGLVGVRVEDPEVFAATHRLLAQLARSPALVGVRVDHIDGLADPAGYLARLRTLLADATRGRPERPVVLVEKILGETERLPAWPVEGTTGYEATARFLRVLGHPAGAQQPAGALGFEELAREGRRWALDELFPGELRRVAARLGPGVRAGAAGWDLTGEDLVAGVRALTCGLDRYRTYLRPGSPADPADRAALEDAAARALGLAAERGGPSAPMAREDPRRLLAVLTKAIVQGGTETPSEEAGPGGTGLGAAVARWQQLASAVAAKGVEDTALWRLPGPRADADVGDQPGVGLLEAPVLAAWLAERQGQAPQGLNPLATHDAKWSGDARIRLLVLADPATGFERAMARWQRRHRRLLGGTPGADAPTLADERRLYLSLGALWPPAGLPDEQARAELAGRLAGLLEKAAREAKVLTSWTAPAARYEAGVRAWVKALLLGPPSDRFLAELRRLLARVAPIAAAGSLGLLGLAHLAPGVPDTYQGSETWLLVGVDPDNRRPLDPAAFAARVDQALGAPLDHSVRQWWTGAVKVRVLHELLRFRQEHEQLCRSGAVLAPSVRGPGAAQVVSLARRLGDQTATLICLRPRPPGAPGGGLPTGARLGTGTQVVLPPGSPGRLREILSGQELRSTRGRVRVAEALSVLPVGLLVEA